MIWLALGSSFGATHFDAGLSVEVGVGDAVAGAVGVTPVSDVEVGVACS
jgi:hypothetical protein